MGTRVYIGRLPYRVTQRDIERFFRGYGRIGEIMIKNGYGFVEFDDYRDADDAVYELNGKDMLGERVLVEHAKGTSRRGGGDSRYGGSRRSRPSWLDKYGAPLRTQNRIIVENLSSRVSWQDLKDFMRSAGEVTYADAHKTRRNEGVVEFQTYADMKRAIDKLDGKDLSGRRLKLIEDRDRSYSRSRSRSRSRRRSRSRSRSRSHSKSKSRSRSRSKSKSRSRSRSHSPRKSHSKSRSPSRSRSRSRSKSKDREMSRSRSRSPDENHTNGDANDSEKE